MRACSSAVLASSRISPRPRPPTVGVDLGEPAHRGRHRRRVGVVGVVEHHGPVGVRRSPSATAPAARSNPPITSANGTCRCSAPQQPEARSRPGGRHGPSWTRPVPHGVSSVNAGRSSPSSEMSTARTSTPAVACTPATSADVRAAMPRWPRRRRRAHRGHSGQRFEELTLGEAPRRRAHRGSGVGQPDVGDHADGRTSDRAQRRDVAAQAPSRAPQRRAPRASSSVSGAVRPRCCTSRTRMHTRRA